MKKKIWKTVLFLCMVSMLFLAAGCGKEISVPAADTAVEQTMEISEEQKEEIKETEVKTEKEVKQEKQDIYQIDPVPAGKPQPVEPQAAEVSEDALHCTISISCNTILANRDLLDPAKAGLIPADGWILKPVEVTFYEGENVFQVMQRVCKQNKIHFEFMDMPLYNSAYIEGIYNFYEFDAGDLSGWMYKVNDWFPNYGCSRYQLKDGDVIVWVYTCDLGNDVGGGYSARNGATE